ncbi:transposase [Myxococcus xanthus]|nr:MULTISPECIES: transposase [Myxococcus]NOJ55369.1 transposase [Myxococcus xanthus]QPM77967.1 transposase [Myxococcus xanthus]QVW67035.1 transposase [Myxococcus xanthus DZ2]UEO06839.1 transposase [Myxococcus xanthus DZ2]UYI12863.1 transposase [Myxococcus xanthus]
MADRRCVRAAGVPREVCFERKWEEALKVFNETFGWGVKEELVLSDSGYGSCRDFREALRARGLRFLVGVQGNANVWPTGAKPQLPYQMRRPRTRYVDELGRCSAPWTEAERSFRSTSPSR